jgi:hypothetical protein
MYLETVKYLDEVYEVDLNNGYFYLYIAHDFTERNCLNIIQENNLRDLLLLSGVAKILDYNWTGAYKISWILLDHSLVIRCFEYSEFLLDKEPAEFHKNVPTVPLFSVRTYITSCYIRLL